MKRVGIYQITDVLPFVVFGDKGNIKKKAKEEKHYAEKEYDGHWVKMYSQRYQLFATYGIKCVECQIEGKYFALEQNTNSKGQNNLKRFHFNLYGTNKEGNEVLITKDHIIPIAKGGKDKLDNYQVMCTKCNTEKGTKEGIDKVAQIEKEIKRVKADRDEILRKYKNLQNNYDQLHKNYTALKNEKGNKWLGE